MIFTPGLTNKIITGHKTMTRQPVKPGETRCPLEPGHTYAIQPGHNKPGVGYVTITNTTGPHPLEALTLKDAKAEGFRTRADYAWHWLLTHGPKGKWDPDERPVDAEILRTWARRYGRVQVWVIEFTTRTDRPRLLHKDSTRGYTTRRHDALPDEPEAPNEHVLVGYSQRAVTAHNAFCAEIDGQLLDEQESLEQRIRVARQIAAERGVSISSEIRVIERRVKAIEAKVRAQRQKPAA